MLTSVGLLSDVVILVGVNVEYEACSVYVSNATSSSNPDRVRISFKYYLVSLVQMVYEFLFPGENNSFRKTDGVYT